MKHWVLLFGILFSIQSLGQKASFTVDQINGEILLSVSIHSGNFCNGIQFLRSNDSINFEVIGTIQGYCGNISETITYNFTDKDPIVNQKSYYKADLVGLATTEIRSILVLDFGGETYQLTVNPITETSTIYFKNAPNKNVTFILYNLSGQVAHQESNTTSSFDINAAEHENGVYIFLLKNEDGLELASGKLMISNL